MPRKKKETKTEIQNTVNSSIPESVNLVFNPQIEPLELSIDFGRQDLNDAVGKLQAKLNEVIKKVN